MRQFVVGLVVVVAFLVIGSPTSASVVSLSFAGTVDSSGATIGGVAAPLGSPFTLDIDIDDSTATTGRYDILGISYTLTLGTYTTLTDWTGLVELVAAQSGSVITLESDPLFVDPDEHFLLFLSGFGPSRFDDPTSWGGPSPLSGDIIVRGIGGSQSPNELSGITWYEGTLALDVASSSRPIPEPATIAIWSVLALVGVFVGRRRKAA